jgi:multidrug efflux pump subunit AcrB
MTKMEQKIGIIEWAMHNRKTMLLLTALLAIAGIYSLVVIPKQEMPEFVIRQGVVVGVYPGANSLDIEQQLTKPLERYLFTFDEVNREKTRSTSKDGIAYIFVELTDDVKDKDVVWAKIKHGINMFKSSLPSGVLAVIANDNFGDVSSLLITLESDDKTYRELDGYADVLEDRLRCVKTVANVRRSGSQKEQITLYIDNDKLSAYGIGQKVLMTNLLFQGFTTSSGTLDNDQMVVPIHIAESFRTEQDIADQIILATPAGDVVRVKDIARVVREYPKAENYITNNGKKCILLSVEVRHDANVIVFGKEVEKVLTAFQKDLPESVNIYRIADQPKVVGESITTFLTELLMAIIAVILVTMILLPFRVAVVSATSIPISIAVSLVIMFACGIPLNLVTLAALIIVLGMIVDNSVVIVDSYVDKLDSGIDRKTASIESAKEYFKSIFSATLAISITFFPFLVTTTGMIYDFLEYFPYTVAIVLAISLIVAMLIIPILQFMLIKKGIFQVQRERILAGKKERRNILDYIQNGYEWLLAKSFTHPKTTLSIALASVVVGVLLFTILPQRMMPIAERDSFAVEIYLPQGSPLEKTAAICDSLEKILRRDERVKSVTTFVGLSSPRFHVVYAPNMPAKTYGQFIVNTVSNEATIEILDEYTSRYAFYFPEAYVRFKQLDFQASDAPVEVRLYGDDVSELKEQGEKIAAYLNLHNEYLWVRTSFDQPLPGAKIELNPIEAGRLGISKATAELGIASGLTGMNISTLWEGNYAVPIHIQPDNTQPNFSDLGDVEVSGMLGASVPLRQVATVKPEWTEGQITHRKGLRMLTVIADVQRDITANKANALLSDFMDSEIIPSLPESITYEYGGEPEKVKEVINPMIMGIVMAIVIIFLILTFHFLKVSRAIFVLGAALLAIFGAAFGVWIMGIDFSVTAMLGIVSLIGIIVRNGIIMVDYIEKLRKEGDMPVRESAIEAGKRRMRPIFLTSACASMGVLPMIISKSPFWSPMGTVIFFGTLISMLFVVTVLPVAYWIFFRKEDKTLITN